MSKKPKRSRHRVPTIHVMRSDPVTAEYQREVDASVARLEARYRKAQKGLAAAELRAQRARDEAQRLTEKQAEARRVAEHRLAEEQRLTEYIEQIRAAAQRARVASARAALERQQQAVTAQRNAATEARRQAARAVRDRNEVIARHRTTIATLDADIAERRRELREIERLMMPDHYNNRDSRRRTAQHQAGA